MQIAPVLNKIDMKSADAVNASVHEMYQGALAELRELDTRWSEKAPPLPELAGLYERLTYLTRWRDLLAEQQFQTTT
jgi:hypothetical protein